MMPETTLGGAAAHMTFLRSGGELLVAVARGQGIELRRASDGLPIQMIAPELPAYALAALQLVEGEFALLGGGPDGVLRMWQPRTGELTGSVRLGPGIQDLAVADRDDGSALVAAMDQHGVALWLPGDTRPRRLPGSDGGRGVNGFKISFYRAFDQLWLACAYSDNSLAVWCVDRLESGQVGRVASAHRGQVWSLIAVDGPETDYAVASGSADGTVKLWRPDRSGGLSLGRTLTGGSTIRRLRRVRDAEVPLLVTASAGGEVALWRFDGDVDRPIRTVVRHLGEVWSLASVATPDGGIVIASGDMHGGVEITRLRTDVLSEQTARVLHQAQDTLWAAASGQTADGSYVAFAGVDRAVQAVDPAVESAAVAVEMHGHLGTVRSLAAAGNALDPHLISGGADRRVLDWDPATGQLRRELPMRHQGEVWALAPFLGHGMQYVASGGADGTVRICPLGEGEATVLATDLGAVNALVATPGLGDDTLLTIASSRGVRVLSTAEGAVPRLLSRLPVGAATGFSDGGRHLVVTARADGDTCVIEIIDPRSREITRTIRYTRSHTQVSALVASRVGDDVLIFGGCEDGQVLIWELDGTLVGRPVPCGTTTVRSMGVVEVGFQPLTSGSIAITPALYACNDAGLVKLWPIVTGSLLRSGGSVGADVSPASILLQDQPTLSDGLARDELVNTMYDVLMAPDTRPPVVIGVHAPWGQGKSSVLRQLQKRLDPTRAERSVAEQRYTSVPSTHELVPTAGPPGRLRRWWQGGGVRTRLTRAWAWRQVQKPRDGIASLGYEMRPTDGHRDAAITIWFNPWMYETPEQIWAGLTREILTGVSDRLAQPQRERLWFDLNLRRTDPNSMRKRILASYIPRSLLGMAVALLLALVAVVTVASMAVTAVQTVDLAALIGSSAVIILTVLGFLGNLTFTSFQKVRGWIAPGVLMHPAAQGVAASGGEDAGDWRGGDPLESTQRGYLYMLQHDVGEVLELATSHTPVVIVIDDLDRCGPPIVADTIEAVNLFLNKAFGPCHFVIALDPATVAAQLETVYDSIRQRAGDDPTSFGHLQHTGWRFMEKVLDLPIRLPRVRDAVITAYLDQLLDGGGNGHQPAGAAGPTVPAPRPPTDDQTTAAGRAAESARPGPPATTSAVPAPDAGLRLAEQLERLTPVRLALRAAVLALPAHNPRQTKAFINLWRFYMVLDYRTGYLSSSLAQIEKHSMEMAHFVELMVRWPWLLDALGAHRGEALPARRIILADLLDACRDDDRWQETVQAAGLARDDPAVHGLRGLFRRPGTDAEVFASIAVRYL